EDQPVQPQVGAPVEIAGIVARRVGPVIREHHARAGAAGAMVAPKVACHGTAGQHAQMLELAKEFFAEQQAFLDQDELPQWGPMAVAWSGWDVLERRSPGNRAGILQLRGLYQSQWVVRTGHRAHHLEDVPL